MTEKKIRLCIAGITGWTGSEIGKAVLESHDFELASAVSRKSAGQKFEHVFIYASVQEALHLDPVDVLIDYTSALSIKEHVHQALENNVNVVVGSSGLSAEDFEEISKIAHKKEVGVIASGNFSITAALAKRFSLMAANHIPHFEVIDYAHAEKIDAPSGTARELAEELARVQENKMVVSPEQIKGYKEARGAQIKGTPVHSLRLPGFVLSFESIFGMSDERLTIRHDAGTSAKPYVDGTLLAARMAVKTKGLVRGLDNLLFGEL
ncbi:MAG: 4-hydroxy-tetrahydrodipicolinate reductase [Cyanobacteria bacterium TGS_CYA1]|nr:4-hydroxy-tetrahydrodipicolinate reductase [Cyanobacteria bacterium TGS_CYA1]